MALCVPRKKNVKKTSFHVKAARTLNLMSPPQLSDRCFCTRTAASARLQGCKSFGGGDLLLQWHGSVVSALKSRPGRRPGQKCQTWSYFVGLQWHRSACRLVGFNSEQWQRGYKAFSLPQPWGHRVFYLEKTKKGVTGK